MPSSTRRPSAGADEPRSCVSSRPGLLDLGRWSAPTLATLLLVNVFAERSTPWAAATASALIAAPVLAAATARVLAGGLAGGVSRREVVAWALFGWMVLATAWGLARVSSDEPARRIALLFLAYWIGHDALARRPGEARRFLDMIALLGAAVATVGLVWNRIEPEPDGRWAAPLESPALLGCFLCLSIPLTAGAWIARRDDGRPSRAASQLLSASLALQLAALIGSGSRLAQGAVLVVGAGWALSALAQRMRWSARTRAAAAVGLCLLCAAAVWSAVRPAPGHESSFTHRLYIWRTSARIVAASPLTGAGVGCYRTAYAAHRPWVGTDRSDVLALVRDAHSDLLQAAAETGLPGGALFATVLAIGLAAPLRSPRGVDAAVRAGLAAWTLNGLANGSVDVSAVGMLAFGALGMRCAGPTDEGEGAPAARVAERRRRRWPAFAGALAALLWLGTQGSARLADLLVAHAESGVEAEPRPYLELALALHPDPHTGGLLAATVGPAEERAALLTRVAALYPWDAELRSRLAMALARSAPEEALAQDKAAVRLDAYNPYYRRRYAARLGEMGRVDEAREQLGVARELFQRTLEIARARTGENSPECEALRLEIAAAEEALGGGTR